jgi:hypothetical protein
MRAVSCNRPHAAPPLAVIAEREYERGSLGVFLARETLTRDRCRRNLNRNHPRACQAMAYQTEISVRLGRGIVGGIACNARSHTSSIQQFRAEFESGPGAVLRFEHPH